MPSYKPRITVYTDEETNEKLAYIAKLENRSSSNYTEYLIKKEIRAFEMEHGEIPLKTSADILEDQKKTMKQKPGLKMIKESWANGKKFGDKGTKEMLEGNQTSNPATEN